MRTQIASFYNELRRNIKRGIQALDKEMPGWEYKINLQIFDVQMSDKCIVGQTKSDLNDQDKNLGFSVVGMKYNNFLKYKDKVKGITSKAWEIANNEWKKVIIARQVQPKSINCLTPNDVISQIVA